MTQCIRLLLKNVQRVAKVVLLFATVYPSVSAAEEVCSAFGCKQVDLSNLSTEPASSFSPSQVLTLVSMIRDAAELKTNFRLIATGGVSNAAAHTRNGESLILYNPNWVSRFDQNPDKKWIYLGLMAHEIGHHVHGHVGGSRPPTELQADHFAGYALHRLGATINEAQSLWSSDRPSSGSATHPPTRERLQAVIDGWMYSQNASSQTTNSSTSTARREIDSARSGHCSDTFFDGVPTMVCVSSYITEDDGTSLSANNLIDGDFRTGWFGEELFYGGVDEIEVTFSRPVSISRIQIHIGLPETVAFSRPASIAFSNSEDQGYIYFDFGYDPGPRNLDVRHLELVNVRWMKLRIDEVHRGERFDEVVVSDLRFVLD